ncbi:MAG TPA: tetratricopeptide repeat protein, partial [Polyangiaceae bacterium]
MRRLIFAAIVISGAACGGANAGAPQATLSASPEAGHAFSELRDAFEHEPHDATLAKRFQSFIAKYPKDASTSLARLHLAHVLLDMKDNAGARVLLAAVAEPPPGNAHDFWLAVRARLLRVDQKADDALAILQPLVGTVVDLPLRSILLEEVAVASIDARRSLEAVGYLDGWLRAVPPHAHKAAHERVREQLGRIDATVLEQTLDAMQGEGAGGYSAELQKLVAEALAKDALDKQDTRLAQKLIDGSLGKYLTGATVGQDLRDL